MAQETMTPEALAQYDGREGRKAYVAVSGKVYDVSASERWREGHHEGAHQAGADLTEELKAAPHVRSVVERFPVVAQLAAEESAVKSGSGKLLLGIAVVVVVAVLWLVLGR